ncbi:GNAT family N-acetyltransferase [Marinospirillum insulare]|uniref:N-acetyltransferase domain-containing protein n=1 Tax=Marinospirillum insulare TaxID=217169 RepID=A0ABQ5ZV11_9GAMM|nr:GNAT family N-acetyltransferase [Marinospirillum insulare]GLR63128.1 hypothetical protein GCM10007878_05630 [Marinospirillum insulare]
MTSPLASSNPNKGAKLTAKQGSWQQLGEACRQIRHKVFIEEQGISAKDELDDKDATSEHFLLLINERPVATARLTQDGHLGRLAVLKPLRDKGLAKKLIARILEHCRRVNLRQVHLNAQISAVNFYSKLGFKPNGDEYDEVGILHLPMLLDFDSQLLDDTQHTEETLITALNTTGQLRIQGQEQVYLAIKVLIQQASRSFSLETPSYINTWFDEASLAPLIQVARRHDHSKVRFLLAETREFSRRSNPLLKLYQRASSYIEIKQSHLLYQTKQSAYLLVDDRHLLWWADYQQPRVELYSADHREAYRLTAQFKLHWEKSQAVKALQSLAL